MSDYSDIIGHPHHQSVTRPHMSMTARAAQFSPFAALTGYDESVREAGRLTEEKAVLSEEEKAEIDRKLREACNLDSMITVTYFIPDPVKDGGSYTISSGRVRRIDIEKRTVLLEDDTSIPIDDIAMVGSADGYQTYHSSHSEQM